MAKHGPVLSPVEWIPGNPEERSGGAGVYNGEDGYPKRTGGSDSLPEKIIDKCDEFGKADKAQD